MKKILRILTLLVIIFICFGMLRDVIIHNGEATKAIVIGATIVVSWLCLYDLFHMAYLWATLSTSKKEKEEQMKINVTYKFNNRSLLQKVFTAPTLDSCVAQAIKYADAYEYDIESIEPIYK